MITNHLQTKIQKQAIKTHDQKVKWYFVSKRCLHSEQYNIATNPVKDITAKREKQMAGWRKCSKG